MRARGLWCAVVLSALLHADAALVEPHREGDEVVYLTLASQMRWDFTHYTVADVQSPAFRHLQQMNALYRLPRFLHPPLYPTVLKFGNDFVDDAVRFGLLWQFASMILLLWTARRLSILLALDAVSERTFYALLACDPLLLFSTRRLHLDGLLGIYLFAGVVLCAEALQQRCRVKGLQAAGLFAAAFNTKYTALVAVPLLLAMPVFDWVRRSAEGLSAGQPARPRNQVAFALCLCFFTVLGLWHYVQVAAASGLPSVFRGGWLAPGWEETNAFTTYVSRQDTATVVVELLSIYPFCLTWLYRCSWSLADPSWRTRSWAVVFPAAGVYLIVTQLALVGPFQLRYAAAASPFLLAGFAVQLSGARGHLRRVLFGLFTLTILLMLASALVDVAFSGRAVVASPLRLFFLTVR